MKSLNVSNNVHHGICFIDCPETYCKFDGDCISHEAVCDGKFDCKDQTDEQGCPVGNSTFL